MVSPPARRGPRPGRDSFRPELENQTNDGISFKKFLGLPLDKSMTRSHGGEPSPDHSTSSRFRTRLSKEAMFKLNNEVLLEFTRRGLTINEGIAVDAKLLKSPSQRISSEEVRQLKEKRNRAEGRLEKNGKAFKFSRDPESEWTVKDDEPHYGLQEHASVDVKNGFILATTMSPASVHDTNYLQLLRFELAFLRLALGFTLTPTNFCS